MTEPVCNCDHIHAVSDQHGGVRVPESVRVQVREVMPLCELAQPACEAVRVYLDYDLRDEAAKLIARRFRV